MGNVLSSPKKLKPGMKVLVYTQPGKFITEDEFLSGLRPSKWIKFKLTVVCSDGWLGLKVRDNEKSIAVNSKGGTFTIVIRSTSRIDNLTPSELRTNERQRKAYRAKKLAATEAKKSIKATGEAGALLADKNTEASKFPFTLQHIADILGD